MEFVLRTGSERLFQADPPQWQKPSGHTCRDGHVVRAVDFTQRNGDVSGTRLLQPVETACNYEHVDAPTSTAMKRNTCSGSPTCCSCRCPVDVVFVASGAGGADFRTTFQCSTPSRPYIGAETRNHDVSLRRCLHLRRLHGDAAAAEADAASVSSPSPISRT